MSRSDRWLRVHMTNDYSVDLAVDDDEHLDELVSAAGSGQGVAGIHPGGELAVIPGRSILWVEMLTSKEDDHE